MKNGIILSHWIEIGRGDFVKHCLNGDYSDRIALLHMGPMTYKGSIVYYFGVQGEKLRYLENAYKATYGTASIAEQDLTKTKERIDIFLSKIDNLLVFS